MQAKSPDPNKIPDEDIVGVTVVLLTCSYKEREFVRVGYYVNNEYIEEEMKENPPARPVIEKVQIFINRLTMYVSFFKTQQVCSRVWYYNGCQYHTTYHLEKRWIKLHFGGNLSKKRH